MLHALPIATREQIEVVQPLMQGIAKGTVEITEEREPIVAGHADYGSTAMIRTGPPVPPLILIGNANRMAPFGGSFSRLAMFSSP